MAGISRTKKYGLVCLLISVVCLAVGGIGFLVGAKAEDIWPPALLIVGGLAALLGLGALFDNGDAAGGAHTTTSSMNDITRNR